jgi:hypothetical protein
MYPKMKTIAFFIVLLATALGIYGESASSEASSHHYVIALAPGLTHEKGTDVLKACFDLALNRAQQGERIEFMDGLKLTRLASVQVPGGSARDRANSPEFLGKFGN